MNIVNVTYTESETLLKLIPTIPVDKEVKSETYRNEIKPVCDLLLRYVDGAIVGLYIKNDNITEYLTTIRVKYVNGEFYGYIPSSLFGRLRVVGILLDGNGNELGYAAASQYPNTDSSDVYYITFDVSVVAQLNGVNEVMGRAVINKHTHTEVINREFFVIRYIQR